MKNKKDNKKRMLSIRTKAEVILIVALFIGIAVSSVWGTVTMTDKTTTTDDSSAEINWADGWSRWDNATVDNQSLVASVFNQWNLAYTHIGDQTYNESDSSGFTWEMATDWNASAPSHTLIVNSDNESWAATAANIEIAYVATTVPGWTKIPPGIFNLTDDIDVISRVDIIGSGIDKTILRAADGSTIGSGGVIKATGKNNFSISYLTVDCNRDGAASGVNCIDIDNCLDFNLEFVEAKNPFINNVRIYGSSKQGIFDNVIARNSHWVGQGFSLGISSDLTLSNCEAIDCLGQGFDIATINSTLTNSKIINCINGLKFALPAQNITINGIEIDLMLVDNLTNYAIRFFTVKDIFLSDVDIHHANYGIEFQDATSYIFINGFGISNISSKGIYHDLTGDGADHIFVSNGVIRLFDDGVNNHAVQVHDGDYINYNSVYVYGNDYASSDGFNIMDASNVTINNCQAYDVGYGIRVKNTDNIKISDGVFNSNQLDGIYFSTTASTKITVIGNTISKNGQSGIELSAHAHDWYKITDNLLFDNTVEAVTDGGTGTIKTIKDNLGYTTESSGLCTIASGANSVTVNHNMSVTPTIVLVTPRDNLTAASFWFADTITSTQFTLNVNTQVTGDVSFWWKAEYN